MVLKKSNSALNTGATQRVNGGGFFIPGPRLCAHIDTAGALEVSVEVARLDAYDEVESCLEQVYDYLGWSGAEMSNLLNVGTTRMGRPLNRWNWNNKSVFSLNKGNRWHLLQRMNALMKDIDFLQNIPAGVDIRFTKSHRYCSNKTVTASDALKTFERNERGDTRSVEEPARSRKRWTYHGRGVQRRYDAKAARKLGKDLDVQDGADEITGRTSLINLTFTEPCPVDARMSAEIISDSPSKPWYKLNKPKKSSNKQKGIVYGGRSSRRINSFEVKEEIRNAFCHSEKGIVYQDSHEIKYVEEDECLMPQKNYNLLDFIQTPKNTKTNKKPFTNQKEALSEVDANTKDKIQHPKGSYILCNRPPSDTSPLVDSSWEIIDWDDSGNWSTSTDGAGYERQESEENIDQETEHEPSLDAEEALSGAETLSRFAVVEKAREEEAEAFSNSFISVKALMPGDNVSLFPEALDKLCLEGRPHVTTGRSLPHCFLVSPGIPESDAYVVGKRASSDGRTWLLSLQGTTSELQANSFGDKLSELSQTEDLPSLVQVITLAEEVLKDCPVSGDVVTRTKSSTTFLDIRQAGSLVWGGEARHQVSIHTADEAAEVIRQFAEPLNDVQPMNTKRGTNVQMDKATDSNDQASTNREKATDYSGPREDRTTDTAPAIPPDTSAASECGVCFSQCDLYGRGDCEPAVMTLSCGHVHCVSCWQAHVHHSVSGGHTRITCMCHGCHVQLDDVTLASIVPHATVTSWRDKQRDRRLEASTHANWCPDGHCGRVAVSASAPLKTQFGRAVVCSCRGCFCGNCQAEPHWPASCDQMAAYRKLLAKTGGDSTHSVGHANFSIELKKCPKCQYPIQKGQGCPSMVCRMCWFNFCWNCLQSTEKHNVYSCKVSPNSKFTTFNLQNKLVYDLPIKFFVESMNARRQLKLLFRKGSWVAKMQAMLKASRNSRIRLPTQILYDRSYAAVVGTLSELVDCTMAFLKRAHTLAEPFYVLLSFVQLNKERPTSRLISFTESMLSRLNFITDRLRSHVIGKSLRHILSVEKEVHVLLKTGDATLDEMYGFASLLQEVSKDIDTLWVADVDPAKHVRYM